MPKRVSFTIPDEPGQMNKDLTDWLKAQSNASQSLRLLIIQAKNQYGATDIVWEQALKSLNDPTSTRVKPKNASQAKSNSDQRTNVPTVADVSDEDRVESIVKTAETADMGQALSTQDSSFDSDLDIDDDDDDDLDLGGFGLNDDEDDPFGSPAPKRDKYDNEQSPDDLILNGLRQENAKNNKNR